MVISNGRGEYWIFSFQQLITCHVPGTFYAILYLTVGCICIIFGLYKGKLRLNETSYLLKSHIHTHENHTSWGWWVWDKPLYFIFSLSAILSQLLQQNKLFTEHLTRCQAPCKYLVTQQWKKTSSNSCLQGTYTLVDKQYILGCGEKFTFSG